MCCAVYSVYFELCTVHCSGYSENCAPYTVPVAVQTVHCILFWLQWKLCTVCIIAVSGQLGFGCDIRSVSEWLRCISESFFWKPDSKILNGVELIQPFSNPLFPNPKVRKSITMIICLLVYCAETSLLLD